LYLGKKIISIPIKQHYEQACNAAALKQIGVQVLHDLNEEVILAAKQLMDSSVHYQLQHGFADTATISRWAFEKWQEMRDDQTAKDLDFSSLENLFC
jgi:hypothetical protein